MVAPQRASQVSNVEYVYGSNYSDSITGGAVNEYLDGRDGDDTVRGSQGDDTLSGGRGDDKLFGNGGDDQLWGHGGNDTLDGGYGSDRLYGHEGDDKLYGSNGDDWLYGGEGADLLHGGQGWDDVSYTDSREAVTVNLAANAGSGGYAEGDTFVSVEAIHGSQYNDTIIGNDDDNFLSGHVGDDMIKGGGGDDGIRGDNGADTLYGGAGEDRFVFHHTHHSTSDGYDIIMDFNRSEGDFLQLDFIRDYRVLNQTQTAEGLMLSVDDFQVLLVGVDGTLDEDAFRVGE